MNKRSKQTPVPGVFKSDSIPTYVINLKKRPERKAHVLKEFAGRSEFSLRIVEAFEHSFGALGLWMTIRHIFQDLAPKDEEFIIICEDDIKFTKQYSKDHLFKAIAEAKEKDADVLLGGISWFSEAVQISENLFWVENFSGLQFTVIYRKFFSILLETTTKDYGAADYKIASLSNNVLFLYPFISIQKEFGYSDATGKNNVDGRVSSIFDATNKRLKLFGKVKDTYKKAKLSFSDITEHSYDELVIPTYAINLPERKERLQHIKAEFADKPEFDLKIIEACKHEVGALGLWLSIRKIINMAIDNDDDVIIICEDDHQFTPHYSRDFLLKNILEAYQEGTCYLSGGTGKFENAIPITENRFWVGHCLSTQFIVIYKAFYQQILEKPYDNEIVADMAYSGMTSNKMLIYPFISVQKDFGYSDITTIHNEVKDLVSNMFSISDAKLGAIQSAYTKYQFQG